MSSLAEDLGIFGFLNFPAGQDIDNLDGNDLAAISSFFAASSAGQIDSLFGDESAGQVSEERLSTTGGISTETFIANGLWVKDEDNVGDEAEYDTEPEAWDDAIDTSNEAELLESPAPDTSNINNNPDELYEFLAKHEKNGNLSKVFERHPMILAQALKSLDNSDILFKFLTKHQCLVANWLEQHKNINVLATFLAKYPKATTLILDEERSLIENFLKEKPEALHIYLDSHPDVLHNYMKTKPRKLQKGMQASPNVQSSPHRSANDHDNHKKPSSVGNIAKGSNTSLSRSKEWRSLGTNTSSQSPSSSSSCDEQACNDNQENDMCHSITMKSKQPTTSTHKHSMGKAAGAVGITGGAKSLNDKGETKDATKSSGTITSDAAKLTSKQKSTSFNRKEAQAEDEEEEETEDCMNRVYNNLTMPPRANHRRTNRRIIMSSEDDYDDEETDDDLDSDYDLEANVGKAPDAAMNAARALMSLSDEDSKLVNKSKKNNNSFKAPAPRSRSARSSSNTTSTDSTNNSKIKKNPKKKPGPQVAWTPESEARAIKHMLKIRDEGVIKGEQRFEEVSNRLNAEFDAPRTGTSVKNWWNRCGRARSGFDERKKSNRAKAPLATSLGGRAAEAPAKVQKKQQAKRKAIEEEEEEEEGEEKEKGGDDDYDDDARARAFANGTRKKKMFKYSF